MSHFKGENLELSLFITAYIKRAVAYYNELIQDIDLTDSQVVIAQDRIEELLSQYCDAQSWVSATMTVVTYWNHVYDYMEELLHRIYQFVCENATQVNVWIVGVCLFQVFRSYCDYAKLSKTQQESNLDVINEWKQKVDTRGKIVDIIWMLIGIPCVTLWDLNPIRSKCFK